MQVNMFDLVKGFSSVVDLVNNTLGSHHQRVGWLTFQLGRMLGLEKNEKELVIAAMLHDLGVIPLHDQIDDLVFEKNMFRHSEAGWLLLRICPLLREEARLVRYHHTAWKNIEQLPDEEQDAARLANLIYLADTVDVQTRTHKNNTVDSLKRLLNSQQASLFWPLAVEAMLELVSGQNFLENLTHRCREIELKNTDGLMLSAEQVSSFSALFSQVIDSRSHFTATHSSGVAHLGLFLHSLAGLPAEDRQTMYIAGLLHDIGKLGVPLQYIEKPGALTSEEFQAVSRHAFLSYEILGKIRGFEQVAPWGAWHHERMNGKGYPNGIENGGLPLESRIMAVADVMTALTEDRPYRKGLDADATLAIIDQMVMEGSLDGEVVSLIHKDYHDVNETRRRAQKAATIIFKGLTRDIMNAVEPDYNEA